MYKKLYKDAKYDNISSDHIESNEAELQLLNAIQQVSLDHTIIVSKSGNDELAAEFNTPFLTITAAIQHAQSGDTILVYPGTYNEILNVPAGISIRGLSGRVHIHVETAQDTTLMTVGNDCIIERVFLHLVSNHHVNLTGILLKDQANTTSQLLSVYLTVDNSSAGSGTSNVYGVLSQANGPETLSSLQNIQSSEITVLSCGNGIKRGIRLAAQATFLYIYSTNIYCKRLAGSGTDFYALDCVNPILNNLYLRNSFYYGSTRKNTNTGAIKTHLSTSLWELESIALTNLGTGMYENTILTNHGNDTLYVTTALLNQVTYAQETGDVYLVTTTNEALIAYTSDSSSVGPNSQIPRSQASSINAPGIYNSGPLIWPPGTDLKIRINGNVAGLNGLITVIFAPDIRSVDLA